MKGKIWRVLEYERHTKRGRGDSTSVYESLKCVMVVCCEQPRTDELGSSVL